MELRAPQRGRLVRLGRGADGAQGRAPIPRRDGGLPVQRAGAGAGGAPHRRQHDELLPGLLGADLLHGVLTLPTIMLLERYPDDNPVQRLFNDPEEEGKLEQVLDMLQNSGIAKDCEQVVKDYCDQACANLMELPNCEARRSLLDLASYVRERRR